VKPIPTPPQHLGIMLTSRCTSRCGHCLYECSPTRRGTLKESTLESCLVDLDALGFEKPSIHLSGGEPFLVFPLLMFAAKSVLEAGFKLDFVETAGGWCTSTREAAERLLALRAIGVEHLLVSAGPFHQAHVPPKRVRRLLRLCVNLFGKDALIVNSLDMLELVESVSPEETISFDDLVEKVGADRLLDAISTQALPINLGGRAAETLKHYMPLHPIETLKEDCAERLLKTGSWHLDPAERIHTGYCGGLTYPIQDGLAEWYREYQIECWPISKIVVEQGFHGVVELARSEAGFAPDPNGYVSACHACQDARLELWKFDRYSELGPDGFYTELEREKQLGQE